MLPDHPKKTMIFQSLKEFTLSQPRTKSPEYWGPQFKLTQADIEHIYNHFLEVERPQTAEQIARQVITFRVKEEARAVARQLKGHKIYRPKESYEVGESLVFPSLKFANGKVVSQRTGYNPQYGSFNVIAVELNGKTREFAADLQIDHPLNDLDVESLAQVEESDIEEIVEAFGHLVVDHLHQALTEHENFVRLADEWFVKGLMAEVNIGHLHLAEAVLEINEGGPLPPEEILPHLDMDPALDLSVQRFSLNYALLHDDRFDEVAPPGQVAWYLRRLEPNEVQEVPERLRYKPIPYDRALLNSQLLLLERELDDEWSEFEVATSPQPVVFTLSYPHRWAGTIPLSSRIRPLFPTGTSPRQLVEFIDDETNETFQGWVVKEHRYIFGLKEWYETNGIPIGGFVHLKPGPKPGTVYIGYDRRRPQREWVRLASVQDNRIKFELKRRSVGCGFDDLLIVGTDVVAAIDALWRRAENNQRSVVSLMAELFPELANLTPQNTVHAKTLYSAINMMRRIPPGPLFAELVRHPAFQPVGDHYWKFDAAQWQSGR